MITSLRIKNVGPIRNLEWRDIGKINLFIGGNATGKTFLMKAMYAAIRASEECGRGDDPRTFEQVLSEKLYWTFQVSRLHEILTKGANGRFECHLATDDGAVSFSFGEKTTKSIQDCENTLNRNAYNSVFFPAKEVLSLEESIRFAREQQKAFGFDDTYFDLVKAIDIETLKGRTYDSFAKSRKILTSIIDGRVVKTKEGDWIYKKGNRQYAIHIASEGIKKIAILDTLLGNRYLTPESVLFFDEPEAALHPTALGKFFDIIALLAETGMQVFIATHSYFTVKLLHLLAKEKGISLPVLSFEPDGITIDNMREGMPVNSIIEESVALYKKEVELAFDE